MIEEGMKAPDFSLPAAGGATVSLSGLAGKWVVLYFYPRDDTPGCTSEAQDFSALAGAFAERGAVVVGVSKDTIRKHETFRTKYDLAVLLASDAEGTTCEDYGVRVEKSLYGKTHMGIQRATFLINPEGVVVRVWPKVKVKGHAQAVLDEVARL